jgi:hypothetical protein
VRVILHVDNWQWLVPLVASFGADVAAEVPPELSQSLRRHYQRELAAYEEQDGGTGDDPSYLHDDSRLSSNPRS